MKTLLKIIPCIFLLTTGCASIVRKPEVDIVKKVALLSVYGNAVLSDVDTGSSGYGSMKKLMDGKADPAEQKIFDRAHDIYLPEIGKIGKWEVQARKDTTSNADVKAFFDEVQNETKASAGVFANMMGVQTMASSDTAPVVVSPNVWNSDKKLPKIAQICDKLHVDAIAIIELNLAYETSFGFMMKSIGSTGQARAAVSSQLRIITREGKYAVVTWPTTDSSKRGLSDAKFKVEAGIVTFNDQVEHAFAEAFQVDAANLRSLINSNL